MSQTDSIRAAAAAGSLASEEAHKTLLQSIVDVARAIFDARASSIFLLEAVSGEGQEDLVGMRFPSSAGIAGWVLVTRQPLVLDDVTQDPRHARNVAERTGYVPKKLMAVPLLHEERTLGVLYVLDRNDEAAFTLREMDLLALFAAQAGVGLELLLGARRLRAVLDAEPGSDAGVISRLAAAVSDEEGELSDSGRRLLESLAEVLER
jgi:GAF domain-containing protein